MRIIVQSDDGKICEEIIRPEEFNFKIPSFRDCLINEIRDAVQTIKTKEEKST